MKYQQLNTVIEQLPSVQREEIQQQFDMMFGQAQPLRLALVGITTRIVILKPCALVSKPIQCATCPSL